MVRGLDLDFSPPSLLSSWLMKIQCKREMGGGGGGRRRGGGGVRGERGGGGGKGGGTGTGRSNWNC